MPASLAVVLSLPLWFHVSAHSGSIARPEPFSPRIAGLADPAPGIPASLVPALPGIALGPEPRITGLRRFTATPLANGILGEPSNRFAIHLTGLLRNTDQVVAYLNAARVGAGIAQSADWALTCEYRGLSGQAVLRVWVYREGQGPIPLPAVLLEQIPRFGTANTER